MRRRLSVLVAVLAGIVVIPVGHASATPSSGWTEGFTLATDDAVNCGLQGGGFRTAQINATKTFDADGRVVSSTFEVFVQTGNRATGTIAAQIGPVVVDVPIDPDYLSVSEDLGWAGLDATIDLPESVSGTDEPAEIHLSLFAISGVTEAAGRSTRTATTAAGYFSMLGASPDSLFTTVRGFRVPIGGAFVMEGFPLGGAGNVLTPCPIDVTIFRTSASAPVL